MIRIIHLSDLHVHKSNKKSDNQNAKAIAAHLLNRFKGSAKSKTYVILTGDLTDDAHTTQYKRLASNWLAPLNKNYTLLASPGNHDYAYMGNLFDKAAPKRYRDALRPYVKGVTYPCITVDTAEKVMFIGLDSADIHDKKWFAEGVVSKNQRQLLRDSLIDPQYHNFFKVVYLHHHPFHRDVFVALRESDELLREFSNRVDLVLFGHKHKSEVFFHRFRVPLMLAAGKVTESNGDALAFRFVEIETGTLHSIMTEEIPSVS